jgi:hypothetical protein
MEQLEEIFMNKWSLQKMFPSLNVEDIPGYPNYFPPRLVRKCPKFNGDPLLAITHVENFLRYVSESSVTHQDVQIRLFFLSLDTR